MSSWPSCQTLSYVRYKQDSIANLISQNFVKILSYQKDFCISAFKLLKAFHFHLRGVCCLCSDGDFQLLTNRGVKLSQEGWSWRQELGQKVSFCAGWYGRINWNNGDEQQSQTNTAHAVYSGWRSEMDICDSTALLCGFKSELSKEMILPFTANWIGILLMASLVVLITCVPLVWVRVMLCLGKSSITICTTYEPSLLLLVGLNDRTQKDCKRK